MSDEQVAVVEVIAVPYSVTEVVNADRVATLSTYNDAVEIVEIIQAGLPGPPGPQGPPGQSTGQVFEQYFASPALTWTVIHPLNAYPDVTLYDLAGELFGGTVSTPDKSTVIVTFGVPVAGTVRLRA